jgi:hypothetical protein
MCNKLNYKVSEKKFSNKQSSANIVKIFKLEKWEKTKMYH